MEDLLAKLIADLEEGQRPGGPLEGHNLRVTRQRPKEEVFADLRKISDEGFLRGGSFDETLWLGIIALELVDQFGKPQPEEKLPSPEDMRKKLKLLRQVVALRVLGMRLFIDLYEEAIACVQDPDPNKVTITALTPITPAP